MRTNPTLRLISPAYCCVLAVACARPYVEMSADTGAATDPSSTSTGVTIDERGEPERAPPATEEGDEGAPPDAVFIVDPDGGSAHYMCSLWDQDCAPGEKCNIWASDGGNAWNATKCVPIDPDPDAIGDECSVVESGVSGLDSCEIGAVCWNVDGETSLGTCVAYCTGSEANPICEDSTQHCTGRDFMLCLPSCCPLEQTCHEGEACYPTGDTFECVPDAGGETGAFGDACEFINVCDPGLFCANPEAVPGCQGGSGCCTPYCDTAGDVCASRHPGMECVPWFEEGHAPAGEEHIGACVMPS